MRIAIVGAGMSGLSCANEFVKHGIIPTIFEKKSSLSDLYDLNICMFNIFDKKIIDPLIYLENEYNVSLNSITALDKIIINTPNNNKTLRGKMGYIFKKGREEYSLSSQLSNKFKPHVFFDTCVINIKELQQNYDHVIIATGNNNISNKLECSKTKLTTKIKIATLVGKFELGTLKIWKNSDYCKDFYAYMIANSEKEALLTLIINDVSYSESEYYWKNFLLTEQIENIIIETNNLESYKDHLETIKYENIYFIGDSAGFTADYLGYGVINSIESGILLARCLLKGLNYDEQVAKLQKRSLFNQNYNDSDDNLEQTLRALIK